MENQLKIIFNCLCVGLDLNNFNDNPDYNKKSLKLDYNAIYGGYRIDTIEGDGGTGEGFFYLSSRLSKKEMIAHIQGLLEGMEIGRKISLKPYLTK